MDHANDQNAAARSKWTRPEGHERAALDGMSEDAAVKERPACDRCRRWR
jgi:hypothetical protein